MTPVSDRDPIRIGNCSGFYGDRLPAMHEMLTGGDVDYLTGDYLAELTMLILGRDRMKNPDRGYAKTFLRQLEQCLGEGSQRDDAVLGPAQLRSSDHLHRARDLLGRLGRPDLRA